MAVNRNKHSVFNRERLRQLMINDKHLSLSCRMSMGTAVVYLYQENWKAVGEIWKAIGESQNAVGESGKPLKKAESR
jgi:hypothetical protein